MASLALPWLRLGPGTVFTVRINLGCTFTAQGKVDLHLHSKFFCDWINLLLGQTTLFSWRTKKESASIKQKGKYCKTMFALDKLKKISIV